MTHVLTGTLRGRVITLDAEEPALTGQAAEDRRVRVALEPLDGTGKGDVGESAELLRAWAEEGPQGPIEASSNAGAAEDPDLVLSDEEQRRLLRTWAEQGPQGPIGT